MFGGYPFYLDPHISQCAKKYIKSITMVRVQICFPKRNLQQIWKFPLSSTGESWDPPGESPEQAVRLCFAACQAVNGHRKASQPQNLKAGTCSHDHFQVLCGVFMNFPGSFRMWKLR